MSDYLISPARAWAEVRRECLLHNLEFVRQYSGSSVMVVLKAGAYGHGLEQLARWLEKADIAFFGVASVVEARRLAALGIERSIYLLGPTTPEERREVVGHRWIASISALEEAQHFDRLNSGNDPLKVHITIDTGMGRGGFLPEEAKQAIGPILELKNIVIEGIGSHLPSADEDRAFTEAQFREFDDLVCVLSKSVKFKYVHLSNSAGLLGYESMHTNLVRPGLMLYGISPDPLFQQKLRPVLSLKSRVTLVRTLPAGQGISYGRTCILERETRVATVGIGYGDGYSRQFSGKGIEVYIGGRRCPILGRVTMDQIMVDVSALDSCESGDEVELFGKNILVSELAQKSGLIAWEIFTGITPRVERVYI